MANNNTETTSYFCASIWPLDVAQIHLIIFGISQALSIPFTICANGLLVYALHKTGQFNSISNKFIFMMSLSDLFMGFIGQPMIIIMISIQDTLRYCILEKFVEYIVFLSANFSWFMLLLISVDRYFQITKLNRYGEYMNLYRMRITIGVSFVIANGLAVILLLNPSFTLQVIFNIANVLMMSFVAMLYAYMMRRLEAHNKSMATNKRTSNDKSEENDVRLRQGEKESVRESQKQLSALKTIRMLIIAIFALYGPYNIASTYWTYYKFGKKENPSLALNVFVLWAYFIVLTNAALNAIIIIYGNSTVKRFVLSKLRRVNMSQNKVLVSSELKWTSQITKNQVDEKQQVGTKHNFCENI